VLVGNTPLANLPLVTAKSAICAVPTEPLGGFTVCTALPKNTQYISSDADVAEVKVKLVPLAEYAVVGSCLTKLINNANSFALATGLSNV